MQTLSTAWNSVSVWTRGSKTLLLGSVLLLGLRTHRSASQQHKAYTWGSGEPDTRAWLWYDTYT
ncbi:MAG: hypothetical protein ACLFVO_29795 [Chloroflexaceae bacterium]